MADLTRRNFVKNTAGIAAGAAVGIGALKRSTAAWAGANEKVRVCVIGLNGRGTSHIKAFSTLDDSEVVALCDVDSEVLNKSAAKLKKATGKEPKLYADLRDVLADDSIDAISIATPNHWHSLAAIWGCQAGKDVYVEKPLSHNVWEGRKLVEAAKAHGRIVQHGTQSRSDTIWRRDIQMLHDGFIGEVHLAKGLTYKTGGRHSIGIEQPTSPPENLDWNLWQGPAEEQKYCKNYVHYNWHWFWDYGNGETGNQLVHQMDLAVWGLNAGLPTSVQSAGGRYHWKDQGETPNVQITTFGYANGKTLVAEVRNVGSYDEAGVLVTGNTFLAEKGYYVEKKGFFDYKHNPIPVEGVKVEDREKARETGHFGNFIDAVRSRKNEDLHATALQGHVSSVHCHLGNISYRLGRSLAFDPKTERFVNDSEADAYLTRNYRSPFLIPETV